MADDDDDDTFGEFASASLQSNYKASAQNSLADEEWGDFVKSPQKSNPSEPSTLTNLRSNSSVSQKLWVKPSGALPLSIFGDTEGDEAVENTAAEHFCNQEKNRAVNGDLSSKVLDKDVSKPHNLSIADLYEHSSMIKLEEWLGPDSTGGTYTVENIVSSRSNQNASRSTDTALRNEDLSYVIDRSRGNNVIEEVPSKSYVRETSESFDLFENWEPDIDGFSYKLKAEAPNGHSRSSNFLMNNQTLPLDSPLSDIDDDAWEFKDAYSGSTNGKVGILVSQVPEENSHSSGISSGPIKSVNFSETSNGLIDFIERSNESAEYIATLSGISSASHDVDLVFSQQSTDPPTVSGANLNTITEPNDIKGVSNCSIDVQSSEDEEEFGEFASAFAEKGSKLGTDRRVNSRKDAIPLSVFDYEPTESDGSVDVEDTFTRHQSFSDKRNRRSPTEAISIDDLISSLRTPAEPSAPADTVLMPAKTLLSLPNVLASNCSLVDNNYLAEREASVCSLSSELKINSHLDFYFKLKEELCFVAKCHIDSLKHAKHNSAIYDEDARATSLDSEFKLLLEELKTMNFVWEDSNSRNHYFQDNLLNQLVEVLQEPQFQVLESEYQLSQKLLGVKKDVGSAMELIRHTATMIKILSIGTIAEQRAYVSVWSEMLSVCAAELKHGASIWDQAVDKHVQKELLSEPKGKKFFLALGEIYKAAVVIGASVRLFKPWILSDSLSSPAICAHLEECHAVWSSSGLEGAISSISDPTLASDTTLSMSIKCIFNLDLSMLEKHVFAQNTSRCGLSLLTSEVVPGMKMVMWGNAQCIVTLGNLYSNLISRNPPRLPEFYIDW